MPLTDVWGKPVNKVVRFNDISIDNICFIRHIYSNSNTKNLARDCKNNGLTLEKHSNDNLCISGGNVKVVYSYGKFTAFSVNGTRFFSVEYATCSNTTTNHVNQFMSSNISRCYSNKKRFNECNGVYNWFEVATVPYNDNDKINHLIEPVKTVVSIEGV